MFYKDFNVVPKVFFFNSIYIPNVFKIFQSYAFSKQYLKYKQKRLCECQVICYLSEWDDFVYHIIPPQIFL